VTGGGVAPGKQPIDPIRNGKRGINGLEIPRGLFLDEILNVLILTLARFIFIVKFLGWVMRFKKQEATAPPPLTKDQKLLFEIRDLLKRRRPN
jgi:large conductance mechanosensitive channel